MKAAFRSFTTQFTLFIILLLIGTGCTPATSTPIVLTSTSVVQPNESPSPPSQSQEPSFQGALTANETKVEVQPGSSPSQTLQKFETVNIPAGGKITLDPSGRGVLRFGDRHEVDLFGNTSVVLDEATLESGGSIFIRLKQISGHIYVNLNEQSVARVTVETGDATITTLEQGTKFAICYNPGKINCIDVRKGSLEATSQGEKWIYREGEATFFEPGQPPQPPICVSTAAFDEWLTQKRGPGDTPALSALVKNAALTPCSTPTPEGSVLEASSPTPTMTPTITSTVTITPTPTRAIIFAAPATPTPTKKPRAPKPHIDSPTPTGEVQPPPDTQEPPTEVPPPPDTQEPPTEAPPSPDTTEPPSVPQPPPDTPVSPG